MNILCIRLACVLSMALLLPTAGSGAANEQDRLPIPDAEAHAATIKIVQDIYKKDIEDARSSEQKRALAAMLLSDGLATSDDASGRYVLLQMASDLAATNGDIQTALRAIDQTAKDYEVNSLTAKSEVLISLGNAVQERDEHRALVLAINELLVHAIAADRYNLAKQLATLALTSARKSRDVAIVRQAIFHLADVEELEKEYAAVAAALVAIETTPADPDANLAVGRFLSFLKGDWESGIPMLAVGNDPALKNLAKRELAAPTTPEELVRLGDEWWMIAQNNNDSSSKFG